jgi:hypothetical protein
MDLKGLKRGTAFLIETSLDSKWILNEKNREASRFKFKRI